MRRCRAAVIGCGGRSRPHIQAYDHLEQAEAVACCDLVAERRERVAAEFGKWEIVPAEGIDRGRAAADDDPGQQ
jgi:predicted dehydrogenase